MSAVAGDLRVQAGFDDFKKLDVRVGRIVEAPFPQARNPSYEIAVDLGPLGNRWSNAQAISYAVAAPVGTEVACVRSLSSRNIAGLDSRSARVKSALDILASAERCCIRSTPAKA